MSFNPSSSFHPYEENTGKTMVFIPIGEGIGLKRIFGMQSVSDPALVKFIHP
jgi:hypothetical protein